MKFKLNTPSEGLEYNSRILIIDGLNHFIRSFAAVPIRNEDGEHVGGIHGFVASMMKIAKQVKATRVIVTFDGKNSTKKRKQIFKEYKDNRLIRDTLNRPKGFKNVGGVDEDESFKKQFKRLYEYLLLLPIDIILLDNLEADDIIAHLTQYLPGDKIICSTDKDFYQLLSDNVTVYNPVKKIIIDENEFRRLFPTSPKNFIYWKAVIGDESDNVPGVKGVGKETMKKFEFLKEDERLTSYQFYRQLEKDKSNKAELILKSRDIVDRNFELMQLHEPLVTGRDKLKIQASLEQDVPSYNTFLLRRLIREDKMDVKRLLVDDGILTQLSVLYRKHKQDQNVGAE